MQNVELELPALMNALVQSDFDKQRQLVNYYYTKSCRLTHALVIAENREELLKVYQFWKFNNRHNAIKVHELLIDQDETKVWVQFTQTVDGFYHGVSFDLNMSTLLYLEPAPHGKLISKQVDFHSFESIVATHPLFHWMCNLNRKASTLVIVTGTGLVAKVWPHVESCLKKVKVINEHWEGIKWLAKKVWWRDSQKFHGVAMAPYHPEL